MVYCDAAERRNEEIRRASAVTKRAIKTAVRPQADHGFGREFPAAGGMPTTDEQLAAVGHNRTECVEADLRNDTVFAKRRVEAAVWRQLHQQSGNHLE